jgi:protein neuralized
MGNSSNKPGSGGGTSNRTFSAFDETIINRGTIASPKPLIKFHTVHGSNITLSDNRLLARRRQNVFCKGLVFSDRPIEVDEIVCIRLTEVCNSWSGVLRFGVTNVDPASFRDIELPKFACPDLTAKTGYWAKALADRYSIQGSVLHFHLSSSGTLYIGCNGYSKGSYLHEIDVSKPLWIMMDIYGKSVAVEFLNEINDATRTTAATIEEGRLTNISNNRSRVPDPTSPSLATSSTSSLPAPSTPSAPSFSPLSHPVSTPSVQTLESLPYRFHTLTGVNVTRVSDWEIVRKDNQYDRAYCFLSRPIVIDEVVSIKVLAIEQDFHGSLAFGLTNCKPSILRPSQLPADCDDLLERLEYWVVIKDVAALPERGDILSFCLKQDGRLLFAKNRGFPRPIMFMDTSVELWPFFDVFGRTKRIQLIKPQRLNTLSEESSDSRESSTEPPARPPPPRFAVDSILTNFSNLDIQPLDHTHSAPSNVQTNTRQPSFNSTRTYEPSTRESNAVSSLFNLRPSNSDSVPVTDRSFSNNVESSYRRYDSQINQPTPERSPLSDSYNVSNAASAHLNNAENLILRNLATLYTSPTTAGSAPQFPTPIIPPRNSDSSPSFHSRNTASASPAISTLPSSNSLNSREKSPNDSNANECVICFSSAPNAAVYRCGHVCMCLGCARQLMGDQGKCPMCRQIITDVVQLFFS